MAHKAGFVNIIGNPNVGKSTLMNTLMGDKLSIITAKAQTTRHRIRGIFSGKDFQIVYSDTPGILEPKYRLQKSMMKFMEEAINDADIFLLLVEANQKEISLGIIERLVETKTPILLLINKVDLSDQSLIAEKIEYWNNKIPSAFVLPISALHKYNIDTVFNKIIELLPESPAYFSKDEITDREERFFVSETIREKILEQYKQEIPYSVEIKVESFKEDKKIIRILAIIYVMRESQKNIIIGNKGNAIKYIGIDSRKDLEKFFNKHIHLELFVKVSEDWRNNQSQLKRFGY